MKTFKTLAAAEKHAENGVMLQVCMGNERLYITGNISSLTEVSILQKQTYGWNYVGQVIMQHLVRLLNANHAVAQMGTKPYTVFDKDGKPLVREADAGNRIDRWYDVHVRSWTALLKDPMGNQLAPAIYHASKAEIEQVRPSDFIPYAPDRT